MMDDPVLPHDPESEMAVLGAMLINPDIIPAVMEEIPGPHAFHMIGHNTIYATICKVYEDRGTADGVQVLSILNNLGALDSVGGPDYIGELAGGVPCSSSAVHYAKIIREKHTLRRMIAACEGITRSAYNQGARTVNEIADAAMAALTEATTGIEVARDIRLVDAMLDALERMTQGESDLLPTGITAFDSVVTGIPAVGITAIVARNSHGKSLFAAELVRRMSLRGGIPSRMFSFEVQSVTIAENILTAESGVPVRDMRRSKGKIKPTPDQQRSIEETLDMARAADCELVEELVDANNIATKCRRYAQRGVKIIVVDYVQNLPDLPSARDRFQSIENSIRTLQRVAIRYGLCVILVAQVDKASANGPKDLGLLDCFGGKALSDVANMGISLCAPYKVWDGDGEEPAQDLLEVDIVKNKCGPLVDGIDLSVDWARSRINDGNRKDGWRCRPESTQTESTAW